MKKRISIVYYLIIWAVVVATFNVLVFLITKSENQKGCFWTAYGFTLFAFVANLLSFILVPNNSERINTATTFSFFFAVVCLFLDILFIFIPPIAKASFLWAFIPLFLILAIFVIFIVFGALNQAWIKNNPQKRPEVFNMSQLVPYLQDVQSKSGDVAVRNGINDLVNLALNALPNPDNKPEVEAIEKQIFEYTSFIRKNVERNEIINVFNNIDKVKKLLKERDAELA